jgi:mono/diheme cytochrome c family protein
MKKSLVSLLLVVSSLFALSGEEVYTQHCASCHTKDMMMDMGGMMEWRKKMQSSTKEERQTMRQKMMNEMQKGDMKAPAMPMISMRIKHMTDTKEEFVNFVKDYIQNPSQEKGYCMPMAYKRFGVMPAVGKGMSEKERELVSQWLYDNFEGSWKDSMDGMMCENKNMMNGSGKCGSKSNEGMRCGSGKCGRK